MVQCGDKYSIKTGKQHHQAMQAVKTGKQGKDADTAQNIHTGAGKQPEPSIKASSEAKNNESTKKESNKEARSESDKKTGKKAKNKDLTYYDVKQNEVPSGYCAFYHVKELRCNTGKNCTYEHLCPICKRPHPMFMHSRKVASESRKGGIAH